MPRGTNDFKTMEFTNSGICKNALSDNIEQKDAGDQLNAAFSDDFVECKELDESLMVEKGKVGKVGEVLHDYALKPAITGAAFGATSYGVGTAINKQKAKAEKKEVRERAMALAKRDLQFEIDHPRKKDGKFANKGYTEKNFIGAMAGGAKRLKSQLSSRLTSVFKPKAPPKPTMKLKPRVNRSGGGQLTPQQFELEKLGQETARRRAASGYKGTPRYANKPGAQPVLSAEGKAKAKKLAKYGAAIGGGAVAADVLSGNTRRRMLRKEKNDMFD